MLPVKQETGLARGLSVVRRQSCRKDAVDALLAGKKPAIAETRQRGCGIAYGSK
jgi:hypothetical protein